MTSTKKHPPQPGSNFGIEREDEGDNRDIQPFPKKIVKEAPKKEGEDDEVWSSVESADFPDDWSVESTITPSQLAESLKRHRESRKTLENRVESLEEDLESKFITTNSDNPSAEFRSAVGQSLTHSQIAEDKKILQEFGTHAMRESLGSSEIRNEVKKITIEPIHKVMLITGAILGLVGAIASVAAGALIIALIFFGATMFLAYSYHNEYQ